MAVIPPRVANQYEEIKLRGVYLQFAVDAEFIISSIIVECFTYNKAEISAFFPDKKGKPRDLDELSMSEKIHVCREGLRIYHPSFYSTHLKDLEDLDNLRDLRNKFAHYKMDFDKTDANKVWLSTLATNYRVYQIPYNVSDLWKELGEYRKNIMNILVIIQDFIERQKPTGPPIQP